MNERTPDLGAQDPELRNSPVAWETDEDTEALREAVPETGVCYFNDQAFAHGKMIKSGTTLLRCDLGLWVPSGSTEHP